MRIVQPCLLASLFFFVTAVVAIVPLAAVCADEPSTAWSIVAPGVLRSAGMPCSYALIDGDAAILIGAARGADPAELKRHGVKDISLALLTHHHRDSVARLPEFIAAGVAVRAPLASAPWIRPEGVRAFWDASMPRPSPPGREPPLKERTFGDWVYLVLPEGFAEVDCSLCDGERIEWRSWRITCLETPGHSRDHMAFAASRAGDSGGPILFCGDALSAAGKMPTPYTTDWDHWTGRGLQAAFQSLRKLAALNPSLLCPEHGPPIADRPTVALYETAMNAAEAAFLKSYERFSKERLGNPPTVAFLAKQQVVTAGDEPWTELSPHLFLTGNTFALVSRDGPLMLLDAYGPRIVEQLHKLQTDRQLGPLEVVTISHAHNDHYKGIYLLPDRQSYQVWTQARVAEPLLQPYRYLAPYVDARPLKIDRALPGGERVRWHEYDILVHHLPGQTDFSMGLEFTVDGKRCFATGDSFFHADHFSGSGGWSGRNRGLPLPYAASAQKILDAAPDWILCEHGGAFTFEAEDFGRRVNWAEEAARAADALSPNGDHYCDWDPQRIRVEPLLQLAHRDSDTTINLTIEASHASSQTLEVQFPGGEGIAGWSDRIDGADRSVVRRQYRVQVSADAKPGRRVLPLVVTNDDGVSSNQDGSDTFFVLDILE